METMIVPSIQDKLQTLYTAVVELGRDVEKRLAPTAKETFLESLQINQTLAELTGTIETISIMARGRAELDARLQTARKNLEEAKSMVLLYGIGEGGPINGKNEQIRSAQLADLLKHDRDYNAALADVEQCQRDLADTDAELSRLRSMESALKIKARLAAATLEYLAG